MFVTQLNANKQERSRSTSPQKKQKSKSKDKLTMQKSNSKPKLPTFSKQKKMIIKGHNYYKDVKGIPAETNILHSILLVVATYQVY